MSDSEKIAIIATDTGAVIGTVSAAYRPIAPSGASGLRQDGGKVSVTVPATGAIATAVVHLIVAEPEILEVRWGIQIGDDDGGWSDYSQGTWPDAEKDAAEQMAAGMYGGQVKTRLFKVVRMVDPDWQDGQ